LASVTDAIDLAALPDHPAVVNSDTPVTLADLAALLGVDLPNPLPTGSQLAQLEQKLRNLAKIEAPLAVQGQSAQCRSAFGWNQVDQAALSIPVSYGGQSSTLTTRKFTTGQPVLTLDNPFPGQGTGAARVNVLAFPPDNKASSVVQWSFDIQRALPAKVFLTVGYVGSKTSHLDNTVPQFNTPGPSTNTDFNSRRPVQAYVSQGEGNQVRLINNIRYLDSYANANYNALQVQAEKRYSGGLVMGLAYTYGKALGEGYGRNDPAGDVSSVYQDPRNRRANRGRYGFDVTHNAVVYYVYDLPILRHSQG